MSAAAANGTRLAVVAIGRNEGARLAACLDSLSDQGLRLVYVDSGSMDGSVDLARQRGVEVVDLDMSVPFTAARGRNAGVAALMQCGPVPDFVQFVDGDCRVQPSWIASARAALETGPELGIVTGWCAETTPEASIYNAMCHHEWRRPAGEIEACGGNMMVRMTAFEVVGGFDGQVIAAEDDEFCIRIRRAGWKIRRLPLEMALHDAAMTRFGQWWRRAERAGHGFAQVGTMYPDYFISHRRRVWIYGLAFPLILLVGLFGLVQRPLALLGGLAALAVLVLYTLSYLRSAHGLMREGLPLRMALRQAVYLVLSKFPSLIGMLRYHLRRMRGSAMRLIEHK